MEQKLQHQINTLEKTIVDRLEKIEQLLLDKEANIKSRISESDQDHKATLRKTLAELSQHILEESKKI